MCARLLLADECLRPDFSLVNRMVQWRQHVCGAEHSWLDWSLWRVVFELFSGPNVQCLMPNFFVGKLVLSTEFLKVSQLVEFLELFKRQRPKTARNFSTWKCRVFNLTSPGTLSDRRGFNMRHTKVRISKTFSSFLFHVDRDLDLQEFLPLVISRTWCAHILFIWQSNKQIIEFFYMIFPLNFPPHFMLKSWRFLSGFDIELEWERERERSFASQRVWCCHCENSSPPQNVNLRSGDLSRPSHAAQSTQQLNFNEQTIPLF